ncbi:unnamed protein product, partial [Prorocentrum cordatum]
MQILRREKLSKKAKHLFAKYVGPCRVAASLPKTNSPDQHISEAGAIAKTGVPDFITHQSTARLGYLPRLLNHAPAVLPQLLDGQRQRKGAWSLQLKKDFNFLRTHLPRERWPSQTQHDHDIINWARQKPKLFTNAVKAALKAYILHVRDQAQGAKLQEDIQMITVAHPTEELDLCDDTNNQKCACYACGRTEHHSLPRPIKHLSVDHRCRKSWHAWRIQTMEHLTEQQIAENLTAIAEATNANKKQGRRPTFSDKPAHPCDVAPLPLLETSPVVPKVFVRLESSPSSPPASSPAGPAERHEVVFITDRHRQAADLQHIMANGGITSISGLDYIQVAIHSDGQTSELMPELRRVQRRTRHGEIAAIYVEIPRRSWYLHDASDVLGSSASKRRTPEAPRGTPEVSETIADEMFAANNVTREQCVANLMTVYETPTNHYDLGATQILDNGARDDLRNIMTAANAEEIDFATADLLDGNIVARRGLRTAAVAPASQNLNTNDAYYTEREDE